MTKSINSFYASSIITNDRKLECKRWWVGGVLVLWLCVSLSLKILINGSESLSLVLRLWDSEKTGIPLKPDECLF